MKMILCHVCLAFQLFSYFLHVSQPCLASTPCTGLPNIVSRVYDTQACLADINSYKSSDKMNPSLLGKICQLTISRTTPDEFANPQDGMSSGPWPCHLLSSRRALPITPLAPPVPSMARCTPTSELTSVAHQNRILLNLCHRALTSPPNPDVQLPNLLLSSRISL